MLKGLDPIFGQTVVTMHMIGLDMDRVKVYNAAQIKLQEVFYPNQGGVRNDQIQGLSPMPWRSISQRRRIRKILKLSAVRLHEGFGSASTDQERDREKDGGHRRP